jgi:hypothetical protein
MIDITPSSKDIAPTRGDTLLNMNLKRGTLGGCLLLGVSPSVNQKQDRGSRLESFMSCSSMYAYSR